MGHRSLFQNKYDRRRKNKRALINRAKIREKYGFKKTSDAHHADDTGTEETAPENALCGIIAEVQKSICTVLYQRHFIKASLPRGNNAVVGDRVLFEETDKETGKITKILARKTKLARMRGDRSRHSAETRHAHVLAANIDVCVIVASATNPPFHPRLIDRYLILCQQGGIAPLVCINKCDLVDSLPDLAMYQKMNIAEFNLQVQPCG